MSSRSAADVGIKCDLRTVYHVGQNLPQITCRYKVNPEDFIVSEIDEEGNIVKLVQRDDLPDIKSEMISYDFDPKLVEGFESVIQKECEEFEFEAPQSKFDRTQMHLSLKTKYPSLMSVTIDKNDSKYIKVMRMTQHESKRMKTESKKIWKFTMKKVNVATPQAIADLAKVMKKNPGVFSFAGNKDKAAVTYQKMTVKDINIFDLYRVRNLYPNITLGDFEIVKKALKLGSLKGNRFQITLRDISCTPEQFQKAFEHVEQNGFINYFGMQRFGQFKHGTADIGRAYLNKDAKSAAEMVLENITSKVDPELTLLDVLKQSDDYTEALKHFTTFTSEGSVMKYLMKNGKTEYAGALESIPYHLRKMYLHALQSLVWNEMASVRLLEFGSRLRDGEQVYDKVKKRYVILKDSQLNEFDISSINLPIFGKSSEVIYFNQELLKTALKNLNIDQKQYDAFLRRFDLQGSDRQLIVKPKDCAFEVLDEKTVKIEFTLHSSVYATELLRELIGGGNLIYRDTK